MAPNQERMKENKKESRWVALDVIRKKRSVTLTQEANYKNEGGINVRPRKRKQRIKHLMLTSLRTMQKSTAV